MEISPNAQNIITEAKQWTFEGDCSILSWMKEIAQDLENRANKTNQSLGGLIVDFKRTTTALDNVTNSLAALQYSQFVESRAYEDDETLASTVEVPVENAGEMENQKSNIEDLNTFLKKNLDMMHNCHDRYALEFGDSDNDDDDTTNNYVYHPKNPYNKRPLPHIYGSKLWKDNWHIGLCDNGGNEFSGDEVSQEFSESSPRSEDSFDSNAANVSEWNSSAWILNEKNPDLDSTSKYKEANLFGDEGSIISDHGSNKTSTSTKSALRTENSVNNEINSKTVPGFRRTPSVSSNSSLSHHVEVCVDNNKSRSKTKNFVSEQDKIQEEEKLSKKEMKDVEPQVIQNNSTEIPPERANLRKKPINLFDDDEFNSIMNQIVDKAATKSRAEPNFYDKKPEQGNKNITTSKSAPLSTTKTLSAIQHENLFDTPSTSSLVQPATDDLFTFPAVSTKNKVSAPVKEIQQTEQEKRNVNTSKPEPLSNANISSAIRTLNLFDSPETSPIRRPSTNVIFDFPARTSSESKSASVLTKTSAKMLFEDDDDDDDFLNIFGRKSFDNVKPERDTHSKISRAFDFDDVLNDEPSTTVDRECESVDDTKTTLKTLNTHIEVNEAKNNIEPKNADEISDSVSVQEEVAGKTSQLKNSSTISKYSNIFLDEPPDDDNFFTTLESSHLAHPKIADNVSSNDLYKSIGEDTLKATTSSTTANPNYNGVGLVMEIPPDDDFESHDTKRIHSIFYDDFSETQEATNKVAATKAATVPVQMVSSSYIFSDEPPSDVEYQDNNTVTKKSSPNDALLSESLESRNRPPVISKVRMPNININVEALMPSAAAAKMDFNKRLKEEASFPSDISGESSSGFGDSKQKNSIDSFLSEDILPNLCKNRARIQVKRRPSTRKARQANYLKTITAEKQLTASEITEKAAELPSDESNDMDIKQQSHDDAIYKNDPEKDLKLIVDKKTDDISHILKPRSESSQSGAVKLTPSLFSDDFSDSDDLFSVKKPSTVANTTNQTRKTTSSLFASDNSDSDSDTKFSNLFGKSKSSKQIDVLTPLKVQQTKSLFTDSEDDDESDLFGNRTKGSNTMEVSNKKTLKDSLTKKRQAIATPEDNPLADLLNS